MPTFYSDSDDQNGTASNHCPNAPGNAPYTDSSLPGTMAYLSFPYSSVTNALTGITQTPQNHLEFPVASAIFSQSVTGGNSDILTSRLGDHGYNYWKDERNEMLFMQPIDGSINGSNNLLSADDPQMSLRAQLGIINGQSLSLQQSSVPMMQNQGLSLSLSTQMPVPSIQYQTACSDLSFIGTHQSASGDVGPLREETFEDKNMHSNVLSFGHSNITTLIPNSKYLKAAHELLNEVVNVEKALKKKTDKFQGIHISIATTDKDGSGISKTEAKTSNPKETAGCSGELSPSEKQDLQCKVTKLLEMLDEVDRRYKHYYHQMQIIVSYFDTIAGCGTAKPYTSLALQTISCHFRCLRDAISGQIQVARKSLGEPDNSSSMSGGLSRLRHIDQQLRQQRAMQQFGVMQPNAWRPQRGLPESSVSILRAWLFEHFLHPYPKDSEKLMLARQTGLSRSQVANWFINARVRLWKPMIEDMHKEEFGDIEIDSNSSSENPTKAKEDIQSSGDHEEPKNANVNRCQTSQIGDSKPCLIPVTETATAFQNESTTQVSNMNIKNSEQRSIGGDSSFLQDATANADQSGRFFTYQMGELGQYGNSGVSLTLGLQQCDVGLPISDNHQSFLALRGNDVYGTALHLG
ncbi:BEL1-like homeodomain protein 7 [Zingiber officinale]|nr:BEL1-like homeodomain protein 7 [Zingiber officinale]XP_042375475.1 BEL1-like homeodomain protein 7 [Zingiber officinale]